MDFFYFEMDSYYFCPSIRLQGPSHLLYLVRSLTLVVMIDAGDSSSSCKIAPAIIARKCRRDQQNIFLPHDDDDGDGFLMEKKDAESVRKGVRGIQNLELLETIVINFKH